MQTKQLQMRISPMITNIKCKLLHWTFNFYVSNFTYTVMNATDDNIDMEQRNLQNTIAHLTFNLINWK